MASAAGLAIAAGIVGAGSAVAATPTATATATATAKTVYYTPDVAAIAAHLPKGAHVELVPAQSASTIRPAIIGHSCQPNWGVEMYSHIGNCWSYGYTGTILVNQYVAQVYTNNNYGYMSFNKDLIPYSNYYYNQCEEYDFSTGTYNTALVQSITISGWQNGICTAIARITY